MTAVGSRHLVSPTQRNRALSPTVKPVCAPTTDPILAIIYGSINKECGSKGIWRVSLCNVWWLGWTRRPYIFIGRLFLIPFEQAFSSSSKDHLIVIIAASLSACSVVTRKSIHQFVLNLTKRYLTDLMDLNDAHDCRILSLANFLRTSSELFKSPSR